MKRQRGKAGLGGISAGLVLAAAVVSAAFPGTGLALGGFKGDLVNIAARGSFASFTPASVDPALVRLVSERATAKGRLMRFTPAGAANRPDRSVTVAIRVDAETARAISVRTAVAAARGEAGRGLGALALGSTRYNLGVARGYKSFAQPVVAPEPQRLEIPDLASFAPKKDTASLPGRFNPRIAIDTKGSLPATSGLIEGPAKKTVNVGGSYRVLRNLDLTAGVRYSQDRDRLNPLTDGRQDSQAVYIGTQFRF
jgi:hypothetical protein